MERMERNKPLVGVINWIILLIFLCVGAGSLFVVPTQTQEAFSVIVSAFQSTMVGSIWTFGVVTNIALVAGLLVALATGFYFVKALRDKDMMRRAKISHANARALKAEREARIWFSELPPGHQLYKHELSPGSYSTPLHLSPARSNGEPARYGLEDWRAWQFDKLANATAQIGRDAHPLIEGPSKPGTVWPSRVNLLELLPSGQGDLNNIILGVTIDGDGLATVTAPLEKMVHVAVGGASGWGKSEFLRAFAFQIATAPQAAELALVDIEAATFSTFARSPRLRYPIADSERDILAIFADLQNEIERRKGLFSRFPTVDKLSSYNALADEPLPVITVLVDEGTVLLSDNRDIEALLKSAILRARKYGIYATIGGQSWKASDFDTAIRGQFSTTVHFQARDKTSSRVLLGDPAAAEIDQIGRAYAVIPGRRMVQIQAPALSLLSTQRTLSTGFNPPSMPAAPEEDLTPDDDQDQKFKHLVLEKGMSRREAALAAYGKEYAGAVVTRGKRALGEI